MRDPALANHWDLKDDERRYWNCDGEPDCVVEIHAGQSVVEISECPLCRWIPAHPGELHAYRCFLAYQNHGLLPAAGGVDDQSDVFWRSVNVLASETQRIERESSDMGDMKRRAEEARRKAAGGK